MKLKRESNAWMERNEKEFKETRKNEIVRRSERGIMNLKKTREGLISDE